jgi:uncharacterized protein YutE (UPF0331/DUF86 family)
MVDPGRVRRLLEALTEYRAALEPLRELEPSEYRGERALAGRYLVQASAQACIDIANHVIASSGWRPPADFRDAFAILAENGVLDAGLAERMQALAGLRNRLVHVYEDVDDAIVHESLPVGLTDLDEFSRVVARLVT